MTETALKTAWMIADARRTATALSDFPGPLPATLADAYAMQQSVSAIRGGIVSGWKVGRITGPAAIEHGRDRFIGPIYADTIQRPDDGEIADFPVIANGTAALEAEVIAVLISDLPPPRTNWTAEEIRPLIKSLHIGIEVAGSPVPQLGALGPLATIAAFGNNAALIIGPAISEWSAIAVDQIRCQSFMDGRLVATGDSGILPGGPLAAIAFALNEAAGLGIAIEPDSLISTGAITGIHPVLPGQEWQADFAPFGLVKCLTVEASPTIDHRTGASNGAST